MNTVKTFLGNTLLTIPAVFKETGFIGGSILYGFCCILNVYTTITMIEVAHGLAKKRLPNGEVKQVKTYTDLAERMQGKKGRNIANVALIIG